MSEIEERIKRNIAGIMQRIGAAAEKSGRRAEDVTLVVVSKYRTMEEIEAAVKAGAVNIGENRVQEAEQKKPLLPEGVNYRMIGHLQRNKAATAVEIFDAIDSVDSIRLAEKINEEAFKAGKRIPVLAEVNSSGEESKYGAVIAGMDDLVEGIAALPALELKGIMTIGPLTDDEEEIRTAFMMTRGLFDKYKAGNPGMQTLSMGMTDDFETAITEGSNMVRIGRAVFERG